MDLFEQDIFDVSELTSRQNKVGSGLLNASIGGPVASDTKVALDSSHVEENTRFIPAQTVKDHEASSGRGF